MPFTADTADALWTKAVQANRGFELGMRVYKILSWNEADFYRVVVITMTEETEIIYWKATGATAFARNGVDYSEFN
jgi:hypothetical protein